MALAIVISVATGIGLDPFVPTLCDFPIVQKWKNITPAQRVLMP